MAGRAVVLVTIREPLLALGIRGKVMAVGRLTAVETHTAVLVVEARGPLVAMLCRASPETVGLVLPIASLAHLLITQEAAAVVRLAAVQ